MIEASSVNTSKSRKPVLMGSNEIFLAAAVAAAIVLIQINIFQAKLDLKIG